MTLNWDWTGWALWSTSHFWSVTLTVLIIVGILEVFREAQPLLLPAWQRWSAHVFLTILIQLCLNPLRAISGHALAAWATSHQIGLFSLTSLPLGIRCILGILLLDLIHYASHFLYHHSSWLWSFHSIHHNDEDFDWSTGYRFHISESLVTLMIESIGVLIIGLPPESILLFVLLISIQNLVSHADFILPTPLARWLDCIWISPNLHRLHHSDQIPHQQSNYGILLSLWDRLFGTLTPATPSTLVSIRVGLTETHPHPINNPLRLLALPFLRHSHPDPNPDQRPYPQPDSQTS